MQAFICTACGTQYPPSASRSARCTICEDERQFVPLAGQSWTTLSRPRATSTAGASMSPASSASARSPAFAIGQRALLMLTPNGNILWDCISLIDDATVTLIKGARRAAMPSPSRTRTSTRRWRSGAAPSAACPSTPMPTMRAGSCGPTRASSSGRARRLAAPGRDADPRRRPFPGRHHAALGQGAEGRGVVCAADIATVNMDRKSFTFMRSYPNFIPLSAEGARRIGAALAPFPFDRVYSHFFDRFIESGAKQILQASVDRYVAAVRAPTIETPTPYAGPSTPAAAARADPRRSGPGRNGWRIRRAARRRRRPPRTPACPAPAGR